MTPEDKKLAAGFARDVLKTGGILPNDQVSIHLSQNVFNTQVNVIPPIVQELLDKHLSGLDVIDAEIEEE